MIIPINHNGIHLLIDEEDLAKVQRFNLSDTGAQITIWKNKKSLALSRYILNYYGPLTIDHKDRNRFNNSKTNFRFATKSQNMANKVKYKTDNKYKGVMARNGVFTARIRHNKKLIVLGHFTSEIEAAVAYNNAAIKYHGEFACINVFEDTNNA